MKRFFKILPAVAVLLFILPGCRQTDAPEITKPLCTFVTQIDVYRVQGTKTLHDRFTKDGQMKPILHYLRLLDFYGNATAELPPVQTEYRIILTFSDGSSRQYRQINDACISCDNAPWQKLKPNQGQLLAPLLRLLSADYETQQYIAQANVR